MKSTIVFIACVLFLLPVLAHAQGGCVDSPESPTPILALAGSMGFAAACLLTRNRKLLAKPKTSKGRRSVQ